MNGGRVLKRHGQITAALKEVAKKRGLNPNDAYNQYFREVFLSVLMGCGDGWVLKGGSNIYCRIPGARQTRDLDLYRQAEPTSAERAGEKLVAVMDGQRVGPYSFKLKKREKTQGLGAIDSVRVDVGVVHGAGTPFVKFHVDVSGDLEVVGIAQEITAISSYQLNTEFLPREFTVYSYPIHCQIADKACAMYERHGEKPPGRASTRYRDLYDLALIACSLPVDSSSLKEALSVQSRVRKLQLPGSIRIPDPSWEAQYPKQGFGDGGFGLGSISEALRVAGLLLDPILDGTLGDVQATWDYSVLAWRSGSVPGA